MLTTAANMEHNQSTIAVMNHQRAIRIKFHDYSWLFHQSQKFLKDIHVTLTGSWIRSRKLNRLCTWQKINFKCTFCGFSFTPMSKCRKRPRNFYKYKNSLIKKVLFVDHRVQKCTSSFFRNPAASVGSKALWSAVKKTRLNSLKDNFIGKSSRLSTKKKLSILLNFFFLFVFYRRIFNLEIQSFSLENHHMMNARQTFCWWMILETFRFEDEDDYFRVFSKYRLPAKLHFTIFH